MTHGGLLWVSAIGVSVHFLSPVIRWFSMLVRWVKVFVMSVFSVAWGFCGGWPVLSLVLLLYLCCWFSWCACASSVSFFVDPVYVDLEDFEVLFALLC